MSLPESPHHPSTADAEAWLALADAHDGATTWQTAGVQFQNSISASEWAEKLTSARRSLGPLSGRRLAVAQSLDGLPGAPPGRYALLQYHAVYDGRQAVTEQLTLEETAENKWQVVGYFIR